MFQLWFTPGRGKLQFAGDFPSREAATKEIRRLVRTGKAKDAYWRIEQKRDHNPSGLTVRWRQPDSAHWTTFDVPGAEFSIHRTGKNFHLKRREAFSDDVVDYGNFPSLVSAKRAIWKSPRESNPIHRVRGGWKWGKHGHVYPTKAGAERQMRAIFASGYRERNPGPGSVHTAKWDRCFKDVKAKGGAYSPAAVCTAMLGEKGSIKPGHRRKNPVKKRGYETGDGKKFETQERAIMHAAKLQDKTQRDEPIFLHGKEIGYLKLGAGYIRTNPLPPTRAQRARSNPSGFDLEKTQRVYFMVHAHKGRERLWLTPSGTLSADKARGSRYAAIDTAVARAKAFLKRHPSARSYRFDICLAE